MFKNTRWKCALMDAVCLVVSMDVDRSSSGGLNYAGMGPE